MNGDGAVDLLTGPVLLGNGDGTFTALPQQIAGLGFNITVADINGDGKLDLVGSEGVSVALGNGDGTFGGAITVMPPEISNTIVSGSADGRAIVAIADFNSDHRPDIALVVSGLPGGVVTLLNTSPRPSPDFLISATLLAMQAVAPDAQLLHP